MPTGELLLIGGIGIAALIFLFWYFYKDKP